MTIKQYQDILILNSGATDYEVQICSILDIPLNKKIEEIKFEIEKALKVNTTEFKKKLKVNGKWYMAEEDMLECTYEQFVELDRILAEGDNIQNLHRLISIYFRPRKFSFKKWKYMVERFDIKHQEKISKDIQEHMNMEEANGLILFFYQCATESLKNMNIFYLNQMKQKNTYMLNKLKE